MQTRALLTSLRPLQVRDLLDDEVVWCAPGQVARASQAEAMRFLRADLLPPATAGPPVTPFTAHAGAPVQLAYNFWDRRAGSGGEEDADLLAALQDAVDKKTAKMVVGVMLEPVGGTPREIRGGCKAGSSEHRSEL